jgi:hypothetical protein
MMMLREWVRLPTGWITKESGLTAFRWNQGRGADNIAALMALAVIAHHADDDTGLSRLTYEQLCRFTHISRAKMSKGLDILAERGRIERTCEGRSSFRIADYDKQKGWAMLPAKRLYLSGHIPAFSDFKLRSLAELNALKLYFLFAAFRDTAKNYARISYDKIEEYTGMDRSKIKGGLSCLSTTGLIHIDYLPSAGGEHVSHVYRLPQLFPTVHMGTTNKASAGEQAINQPIPPQKPTTSVAPSSMRSYVR